MSDPINATQRKPALSDQQQEHEKAMRRLAGVVGKLLAKRWLQQHVADFAGCDAADSAASKPSIHCVSGVSLSHSNQKKSSAGDTR